MTSYELDRDRLELERNPGRVLDREVDLEERGRIETAVRGQGLHDTFEGDVLMLIGFEGGATDVGEKRRKREARPQPQAHHQRVDEEADQRLQLGVLPIGDRRPHDDVVLAAVSGQ